MIGRRATVRPGHQAAAVAPRMARSDDHCEQRPRKAEPVDAMAHRGLESRRENKPEPDARDRAENRGDHSDDSAVRQQHKPKMLLRRADRREHAELAEPTLRDDGEARCGNERGQEQEDGGDGENRERVAVPISPRLAIPVRPERRPLLGKESAKARELLRSRRPEP